MKRKPPPEPDLFADQIPVTQQVLQSAEYKTMTHRALALARELEHRVSKFHTTVFTRETPGPFGPVEEAAGWIAKTRCLVCAGVLAVRDGEAGEHPPNLINGRCPLYFYQPVIFEGTLGGVPYDPFPPRPYPAVYAGNLAYLWLNETLLTLRKQKRRNTWLVEECPFHAYPGLSHVGQAFFFTRDPYSDSHLWQTLRTWSDVTR